MNRIRIFLIAYFTYLFFSSVLYSQENPPDMLVTGIDQNIYRFYVNDYVHVFAHIGENGVLLVDTGFPETAGQIKSKLKELGRDNIEYVVYTHSDGDHTWGHGNIGENTILISHPGCKEKLAKDAKYPNDKLPDMTFEGTMTLDFNHETIKMITIPGGHSTEDVIVYFENAGVVCLGDMVVSGTLPFVRVREGASIYKLLYNVEKVINMFPANTRYFPSHGREYSKDDLKDYLTMLMTTIDIVTKEVKNGKTDEEMVKQDILKDWKDWNSKKWEWINTDLWISTIYYELTQKGK